MLSKEILVRDWNVWQNSWKWKGADLVTCSSSSSFYIFPRLFPIDHRFNSMKNEESLSFSLTLQEVKDSFFFLSCLLRWQSVSFSLVFFPPSYVTRCHESSYTSSPLSNKHRISCYTVHVFSINFIVSASFFRNGRRIETLADYCFVNFVLFIRDIYTEFNFLYFSNLLKSRSIYQSLDTPLDFPSQYKRKKIDTLKLSL